MSIQEEVNLHEHQIKELFEITDKHEERIQTMNDKVLLNYFVEQENSKAIKETIKLVKENREMIEKINIEAYSRRTILDFLSDRLTQPKFLILLGFLVLLADTVAIVPMAVKHIMGW